MYNFKRLSCFIVITIIIFSGSGYVYAENDNFDPERGYIAFRNKNIIKTQDMRGKSQIDETVLREYLKRFPDLLGISSTLLEVQEEYGVNAILLLAIIRLESGNGKSNLAVSKNNLGGIVSSASSGQAITVHRSFDSKEECVKYMGRLLSQHYLRESGRFFSGYTLVDIAKRYSVSKNWSALIRNLIFEVQTGLDKTAERLAQ